MINRNIDACVFIVMKTFSPNPTICHNIPKTNPISLYSTQRLQTTDKTAS